MQADCPTLRLSGAQSGGRCYTCGQPGHLAVSGSQHQLEEPTNIFHSVLARVPVFKLAQALVVEPWFRAADMGVAFGEVSLVALVLRHVTNAVGPITTPEIVKLRQ